jgi:hypothetical protein
MGSKAMKKLVKVGLVVPMVLLVAVAVIGPSAVAADEQGGQAALNRDLNQPLNDRDGDKDEATGVAPQNDAPSTDLGDGSGQALNDAGSGRSGGERTIGDDRASASDRVMRRGQQAPRGSTMAAYNDEGGKKGKDNNSGKSSDDDDENNNDDEDDEDATPSSPEPAE